MRSISLSLLVFGLWFLTSCGGGGQQQQDAGAADSTARTMADQSAEPATPQCEVEGTVLEGNKFWLREQQLLVCIAADSTTYDADLGDSHRVLEVYDTRTCERVERKVLPVNVSPDFAYFLSEITYNNTTHLMAIRGFTSIYIYDTESRQLLPPLKPKYASERYGEDAQSGMILRLELWENYLLGYARDDGSFAFDLTDKTKPKPVMPYAEYKTPNEEFIAMFVLPSEQGGVQIILPQYDAEKDEYAINPILAKPEAMKTEASKSARNNRYLVLRESDTNNAVAIDMEERQRIDLPADVAAKPTQELLKWIKARK